MFVSVYTESDGTVTITSHEDPTRCVVLGPDDDRAQAIRSALSEVEADL